MDFEHFRNAVASPALRAVVAHWDEARGTAPMPSWEQLQPARMAPHLKILWAYKYDRHTGQFIGRLAGGSITRSFEKNFRGLPLQEAFPPEVAARTHEMMLRAISEPAIYRTAGELFRHAGNTVEGERIGLPLAGDGVRGDGVLGASAYDYPYGSQKEGPIELLLKAEEWFSVTADTSCTT